MKKFIIFIYLFAATFLFSQREPRIEIAANKSALAGPVIDVNAPQYTQSNYTIEQLIKNVLITGGSNCTASVSNVTVSPNLSASDPNRSWGYFNKASSNFVYNDGIILSTGRAESAGNTVIGSTITSTLGSGTDADLAAALGVPLNKLQDATYITFDFVPVTNQITFNYLFASEEYSGNLPCTFSDGFALLLKKVGDPSYTNLAVLPNNGGPVSVTNIRPQIIGTSGCSASNPQFFAGYNTAGVETNFNGRTIPLTSTATVIPGQTYNFKIVLADYQDTVYDSGVLFQAGSFNIGVQLTNSQGVALPPDLTICEGSSQVLNAAVQIPGATYQWFFNSNPIAGATSSTYVATQAGNYSVTVNVPNSNCPGTAQINIITNPVPVVQNATLTACSTTATHVFDLTSAQNNISTTPGTVFTYYQNLADAQAGNTNSINNPTAYSSGNNTLYVLVKKGICSAIAQLQLTVNQSPTPVITASSTTICGSGNVTLTSSLPSGNLWSNGATSQSITVNTAGTYTLTNTSSTNCTSAPVAITVVAENNPNIQITGNNYFCTGGSTTLTANSTATNIQYSWSNGSNGASITVNTPGIYTVTGITSGGCSYQNSITVSESPLPIVQNSSLSTCSTNGTATFDLTSAQSNISTSPGITFTYYTNQADAVAGNTNNIPNPTTYNTGSTIIYVRVSNTNCYQIAQLNLNVGTTPTPLISSSAPAICGTTPVTLTSNYPTGNLWSNGATTSSITVNTPGNYSLTVTQGNCTSQPVSVTILQNADPNVQITGNLSFCSGSSTTLTANVTGTGHLFAWSNGGNAQSTTVNAPGNYSVVVTTPAGCQYTASVNVTVDAPINISIAQPAQITCTNSTVTLNATASTFQTGANILWTATAGGAIVSGANTLTPVVSSGGTYTLTITNNFGLNCSQQQSVALIQNTTPPVITLTAPSLSICLGSSITLTANGAQTYTWTGLNGNGSSQTVSPTTTTTYTVTGIGANGCQGNSANITISVVPAINSTLQDIQFCEGDSGILNAGTGPNYTYTWSTGATTPTISVTTAGVYNVTINNGVCTKTFSATVSYTEVPQIKEIIYTNNTLTIQVQNPSSTIEYSIDNGFTWQSSNVFANIIKNTNYIIAARYKDAKCYKTIEYYTFFVSNAITPNADGINDYLDFSSVSGYKNFKASIYDRYGKEVFRASPGKNIWNGDYINSKVPTTSYWYQVSWIDPISNKLIEKSGWILVKNRD